MALVRVSWVPASYYLSKSVNVDVPRLKRILISQWTLVCFLTLIFPQWTEICSVICWLTVITSYSTCWFSSAFRCHKLICSSSSFTATRSISVTSQSQYVIYGFYKVLLYTVELSKEQVKLASTPLHYELIVMGQSIGSKVTVFLIATHRGCFIL